MGLSGKHVNADDELTQAQQRSERWLAGLRGTVCRELRQHGCLSKDIKPDATSRIRMANGGASVWIVEGRATATGTPRSVAIIKTRLPIPGVEQIDSATLLVQGRCGEVLESNPLMPPQPAQPLLKEPAGHIDTSSRDQARHAAHLKDLTGRTKGEISTGGIGLWQWIQDIASRMEGKASRDSQDPSVHTVLRTEECLAGRSEALTGHCGRFLMDEQGRSPAPTPRPRPGPSTGIENSEALDKTLRREAAPPGQDVFGETTQRPASRVWADRALAQNRAPAPTRETDQSVER